MNPSALSTVLRRAIVTAILGAVASTFSAVSAADPSTATVTVQYADLNIASPSGARVLYARIEAAAQSACAYFWFKTDADEARCVHNTVTKAVTKVDQAALTAVYNAKFKISAPSPLVSQSR